MIVMIRQFRDCYARWDASELTVGNAVLERSYRLESGVLQLGRLYDRASGKNGGGGAMRGNSAAVRRF